MDPAPDAVRLTEGFFEHLLRLLQSGQKVLPPPPPYIDRPLLERMMKDYDARILRGRDNFTDGNSSIRSPAQSSPSITSLSVSSAPMLSQPATPNFATIPPPIASSLHQRQTQPSMNGPGQAHLNVQTAPNHTPVRRNIPSPSLAYPPPHQPPAGPTAPHMNVNEASMLKPPMNGPNQIGLYANSQTRSATGPSFSLPAREPQPQPQTQPQPRPQPPNLHPSSQFQPFNEGFSVSDSRSVSSSSISFPYDHHQPPRQAQVPMANSTAFHRPADGYSNPSQTVGANVHLGPFFHAAVPNPPLAGPSRQKPNNLHHTNMSAQFHGTNHGRGVPFAPPLSSPDLSQPPSGGHRQVHQIPKPSTPMPSTTPYAHTPLTKVSARPPPPPRRVVLSQTPSRDILRALGRFDLLRGFLDESPDENQAPSASRRPSNPSTEPTTTIPKSPPSNILVQVPDAVPGLPPANLVVVGDSLDPELHSSQSTTPSTDLAAPPPIPPTVDPKTTHPALDQSNPPLSSDSARSLKRKRIDNLPGATHEMDVVTPSKSPRPGFPRLRERSKTSSPAPHGSPSTLVTDHTVPTSPLSDVHVNLPDLPQVVDVPDDTPLRHSVPRGLLPASNRSELRKVSPSTTASPRQPLVPIRPLFIPSDDEASAFGGSPINNHSGASSTTMVTTFKPLNLQPFTRAGSIGQKDAEIGSAQPPSDHLAKPGAPEAPQRRLPQVYVEVPLLTLQQKIAIHVHASREDAVQQFLAIGVIAPRRCRMRQDFRNISISRIHQSLRIVVVGVDATRN
ncbi:hypothetical protein DL93DRAFT_1166312 [Clavulina sp. PMI_390]|nr:hypothetical protein DL93DRAFT_1166312 [Clavulina sp. PMI_390]